MLADDGVDADVSMTFNTIEIMGKINKAGTEIVFKGGKNTVKGGASI